MNAWNGVTVGHTKSGKQVRVARHTGVIFQHLRPVTWKRTIAHRSGVATNRAEESVHRSPFGQVAQAVRVILTVANVEIEHGHIPVLTPIRSTRVAIRDIPLDAAMDLVSIYDDQMRSCVSVHVCRGHTSWLLSG